MDDLNAPPAEYKTAVLPDELMWLRNMEEGKRIELSWLLTMARLSKPVCSLCATFQGGLSYTAPLTKNSRFG